MGAYWSAFRAADPDVYLGYTTYKVVKVKDRYLGLLYYGSSTCIFAYILWNIFSQELYLKRSAPTAGYVRSSAKLAAGLPDPAYCSVTPVLEARTAFGGCLHWPAERIVFPYDGELGTLFITTRVTLTQTPPPVAPCTNYITDPNCRAPSLDEVKQTANSTTFYIANVEDVSLRLDHGVLVQFGSSLLSPESKTIPAVSMEGKMEICRGRNASLEQRLTWDSAYRANKSTTNHLDTFPLRDLLAAADCNTKDWGSLEQESTADGAQKGESLRTNGFVISSPIIYSNVRGKQQYRYSYKPERIANTDYKATESIFQPDGSILYVSRRGIRVVFEQDGSIGVFDFISLLTALVAATALLRVATLIVESLMLWVMPHRHLYKDSKFESTEDFSDIRDRQEEERAERRHRRKVARANGAKPNPDDMVSSDGESSVQSGATTERKARAGHRRLAGSPVAVSSRPATPDQAYGEEMSAVVYPKPGAEGLKRDEGAFGRAMAGHYSAENKV
ncbi:uncharacterized protein EV422DRAFT_11674 [Fimicolochytrium jonesii]|uniref:uncharacterized protein n=1 Tax=Fimicolochytrium jonesii TaxID=1396493 RepID=UPI0022FE595E|nr:uncharacterized protein EV422DRAFT_11674 [Fimicolochytrium jonesii]KAI8826811.1 hypothetical protein EV422DRAFT_11674 [Fimicolochytrium jonesii]